MPTIYVSRRGAGSTQLRLRDDQSDPGDANLKTFVDPSNIVQWELDPRANPPAEPGYFPIASIEGIFASDPSNSDYEGSIEVLEANPTRQGSVWKGKVKSTSPGKGKFESYMIKFRVPGSDEDHYEDPKIVMNS